MIDKRVSKKDGFCIKNEEFCSKNDECLQVIDLGCGLGGES